MADEKEIVASEEQEENQPMLDYSLPNSERSALVQKIIDSSPPQKLTPKFLDILAEYITQPTKDEKRNKYLLTSNRKVTIDKHEMSYEGLVSKFENGEDGIYNLMTEDNKNVIFTPKISITQNDIETIPGLKELREAIKQIELKLKTATKNKKALLKQLIEMRKDQYILKSSYQKPITFMKAVNSFHSIKIEEYIYLDEDGVPQVKTNSISLLNSDHVSALLCNYDKLKADTYGKLQSDAYYLLMDLENLIDETLKEDHPILFDILVAKIDKKTNEEIKKQINLKYNTSYSAEYISSLWRKKIPNLLAMRAQNNYLIWYYTFIEKGNWKRCSKCKTIKLAHNRFFSKNNTSKDHFYSICKECRNKKGGV